MKAKKRRVLLITLLFLLAAATIAFVGSFAKYITSGNVSDSAAAAKFGLNIPGTISLFSDSYTNVQADTNGKKIIAPGTGGQYIFEVTGTAETAYKVSADISVAYSAEWNGYEPLEFSIDGAAWTDFAQFRANLSAALESAVMPANSAYENTQAIYWRWPFSVSPENDAKDTSIGTLAAAGTAPSVTVNIEVTAAQID